MKGKNILLAALLVILPSSVDAQKKKSATKAKVKQKTTVVDNELEQRLESMRGFTQKVMFIDSVVVSKSKLLSSLNIPDEAGSIQAYNKFFNTTDQPNSIVYLNQLRNKCVFSKFADGGWDLYSQEMIGEKWSNAVPLKGLDILGDDVDINWPFLLSDGTTLYFAAKGVESIGGFDIFMTRYDETTQSYLKPENIGMPFNSIDNDYFFIVDEYDGIGWFATDRNQPEGKVCIYSFIYNDVRENYVVDEYTPEQLRQLSEIHSISQTWTSNQARLDALEQLTAVYKRKFTQKKKNDFEFVINDELTYTTLTDFRSVEAAEMYVNLNELLRKKNKLDSSIERARVAYPTARQAQREQYKQQLLAAEKQSEKYETDIKNLSKKIRRIELTKLGK
ncbi:MAG: hypothetical protein SPG55_06960 [Prevotella sp.]|nr:hypothetical protein [Prevotellaceae bacterium]MDY5343924.1 hypothetical protein [Prevotella sp.]